MKDREGYNGIKKKASTQKRPVGGQIERRRRRRREVEVYDKRQDERRRAWKTARVRCGCGVSRGTALADRGRRRVSEFW